LVKLLLQHFRSFDIIDNICNTVYIRIGTFDYDTISNASTEIEDLNDNSIDNYTYMRK
jgi:glycopeptide antibiotics resistance protein